METVNIQYEGSFTSTYTMYTREEYVKALDIGRKWGWTKGNLCKTPKYGKGYG